MPAKKFIVELDAAERARLNALISKGKASAKTILKARILLKADTAPEGPGWRDAQIVEALDTNLSMVMRVREKLVSGGSRRCSRASSARGRRRRRSSMAKPRRN
jgi:hypothetical protein